MKTYTVAGDLLLLAIKAFKQGDTAASAQLFVGAARSKDIEDFTTQLSEVGADHQPGEIAASQIELDAHEVVEFEKASVLSDGELDEQEKKDLKAAVKVIRTHATDETIDISEETEDEPEPEPGDEDESVLDDIEDPDQLPEFDSVSDTDEEEASVELDAEEAAQFEYSQSEREDEIASDLIPRVKESLQVMKAKANDWEVRNMLPVLIKMFPQLASAGEDLSMTDAVKRLMNGLREIPNSKLQALHNITKGFSA